MDNNKRLDLSYAQLKWDKLFKFVLIAMSVILLIIVVGILVTLVVESSPTIKSIGLKYLWGKEWNPVTNAYGALPFLIGTLLTSFTALLISIPFSISIGIYLGEYNTTGWLSNLLKNTVELIAAVPSIIYGFWALFVLVPIIKVFQTTIGVPNYGVSVFTASIVLAVMIIPYAATLSMSLIKMVPSFLKEGAYALGATRYEVIKSVILPYARSGLFAGILLSLGRALGETMAVTLLIGNNSAIASTFKNIFFGLGSTMASVIANEFGEADHTLYFSALIELGLVLFVLTVIINLIGKRIISLYNNK